MFDLRDLLPLGMFLSGLTLFLSLFFIKNNNFDPFYGLVLSSSVFASFAMMASGLAIFWADNQIQIPLITEFFEQFISSVTPIVGMASCVLIVGVGMSLVISLREEIRDLLEALVNILEILVTSVRILVIAVFAILFVIALINVVNG